MMKGQEDETARIRVDGLLLDDLRCPIERLDDDYCRRLIGQFGQSASRGNWWDSASSFSTRSMPLPVMDAVQAAYGRHSTILIG